MEDFGKHYLALGLRPGATREEVHSAFRRKARLYHPDKDASLDAEMRYREARLAYDLLRKATNAQSSQSQNSGHEETRRTARDDNFSRAETKRRHTTSGTGWQAYESDADFSDLLNELKKEENKKRHRSHRISTFCLAIVATFAFMVFANQKLAVWNALRNMEKITSTEGMFSMEIPTNWRDSSFYRLYYVDRRLDMINSMHSDIRGIIYLNVSHVDYIAARIANMANVNVKMAALPPDHPIPSAQELAAELNNNLTAPRNISLAPTNEIKRIKSYLWAKTTLTVGRMTFFIWQAVDDRRNHYTVVFATNNISRYEPFFERMMESFSFNSR